MNGVQALRYLWAAEGSSGGGQRRERRRQDPLQDSAIRRYYDPKFGATAFKVLPGEHYVTGDPDAMLVTTLGSCVAACIRDPIVGVGGMNHFMFPESKEEGMGQTSAARRYGNYAMETLINDVLKLGGQRNRLEVKIFGGANVIRSSFKVGNDNVNFVRSYLQREGFPIAGEDVGKDLPRRIHYFPVSGKVFRLFLRRSVDATIFNEEFQRRKKAKEVADLAGEVELFTD